MRIKPLRSDLRNYITNHGLLGKWEKQSALFISNYRYPSLRTELLEPKSLRIFSFRIDRKYRAIFIFTQEDEIEIVDINDHYR